MIERPTPKPTDDAKHPTHDLTTIQGICNADVDYLCKLTFAAGNEGIGRILGSPAYKEASTAVQAACDTRDIRQVQAACRARWVVVNQLLEGKYDVSELEKKRQ